jgi:hypothetical protein
MGALLLPKAQITVPVRSSLTVLPSGCQPCPDIREMGSWMLQFDR